jgi:nucleotide-binding universal stress UspA family protein
MFTKILHANDGSVHAFNALSFALKIASQNGSELHMVSVEEIPYMPEYIEDVREGDRIRRAPFPWRAPACPSDGRGTPCEAADPSAGRASREGHR